MNYYKVKINETVEIEDTKGNTKEKSIKNNFLVEAESVAEAHAITANYLGLGDYEVEAVRQEKLKTVILKED